MFFRLLPRNSRCRSEWVTGSPSLLVDLNKPNLPGVNGLVSRISLAFNFYTLQQACVSIFELKSVAFNDYLNGFDYSGIRSSPCFRY
jgi:hypothetical protein